MQQARDRITTADITWSLRRESGRLAGREVIERMRIQSDTWLVEHLRNDEGVVSYDPDGDPHRASEARYVRGREFVAETIEGMPECKVHPVAATDSLAIRYAFERDLRALGLTPEFRGGPGIAARVADYPEPGIPRTYEVERRGELHVVTARLAGDEEIVWEINAAKGWNAERIRRTKAGELLTEAEIQLEQFDGVWFPAVFRSFIGRDRRPERTVEVQEARFSLPDADRPLGLGDLRLEVGTQVLRRNVESGEWDRAVWDGEKPLPVEQFRELRLAGKLTLGPTMQAWADGRPPPHPDDALRLTKRFSAAGAAQRISRWERYVADFIRTHSLNDDQTQRALGILSQCQQRASDLLAARRDELDRIEQHVAGFEDSRELRESGRMAELEAELARVLTPIDQVFDQQLVPRLEALLTRRQRAAP